MSASATDAFVRRTKPTEDRCEAQGHQLLRVLETPRPRSGARTCCSCSASPMLERSHRASIPATCDSQGSYARAGVRSPPANGSDRGTNLGWRGGRRQHHANRRHPHGPADRLVRLGWTEGSGIHRAHEPARALSGDPGSGALARGLTAPVVGAATRPAQTGPGGRPGAAVPTTKDTSPRVILFE